ncbi:methyltransferase domain-containing protein [Pseudodesulfovibrio methanolicus]|uniref:Methyltransferase domain-containing protein n=1 Tax=Pseudodesulfovibrio methanolicus TaxID=3126690 RepID=A0ABZ2J394_9BACT
MRDQRDDNSTRRITVLCDAVSELGMGHLVRCSTLCRALAEAGAGVDMVLLHGGRADLVDLPGVDVRVMTVAPQDGPEAAREFLSLIPEDAALAVVDNYRLGREFYQTLRALCPELGVVAYDDFGEKAGLPLLGVINGGLSSAEVAYPGRYSLYSAVGLEYAALPERCLAVMPKADWAASVSRILLVMGGSDPERQTLRLARILETLDPALRIEAVLGPLFGERDPGFEALGPSVMVHEAPSDFLGLAASCDLAVTGGGSTCMELLYLGVPMAVLSLADNQDLMTETIERNRVGFSLGRFDKVSDRALHEALTSVLARPDELGTRARRGRETVDGQGASRLARRILAASDLFNGRGFGLAQVVREYHEASFNEHHHEMGLWGSEEGMRNRFRLAMQLLGPGREPSWLDVGCGPGDFLTEAAAALHPASFTGLDLCGRTLELARSVVLPDTETRLFEQDFLEPVQGEPFSLVTGLGVLHKCGHSLDTAARRLAGLVAPGGRLLLSTKHLGWKRFDDPDFLPYAGHAWFLPEQVASALARHGLEVPEIRGFEPRTGTWVPLGEAHSIMILAERRGA